MAIYHFSAKVIQRSQGRSAVAAAAYRSASELADERLGHTHDFTAKTGVVHSEILLPNGAPDRWLDRATLWNEVEAVERRKDAVLAREVEFALPRELSRAEGIALVQDFVREQFVARGMVADLNVHWTREADGGGRSGFGDEADDRASGVEVKPHAHVMLSMREVAGGGFGQKRREWNDVGLLREWRERWASLANERLCQLGHDVRIDHRSHAEQGIPLEPQHKIGPAGARRAARGEAAERAAEHDAIARRNGARLAAEPGIALEALTRQQSTFTRHDLARFVSRQTDGAAQFASVLAKVAASPALVRLGQDGRGRERFTTREMLVVEQRLETAAVALSERRTHRVSLARRLEREGLGEEQRLALGHATRARDLAVVVGYAGSGKSTLLGVARQQWEAEGYTVRGAAVSGIAAEGLEAGAGIASRTIASLEHAWAKGRDQLSRRDVLVVDEAGMVSSRQLERVLSAAQSAGAKVVLVGDPEQLQAIEAGAAFRAVAERVGSVEITMVRRQREGWQQAATRELATGRTAEALGRYEAAGMVQGYATLDEACAGLVAGWDAARRQSPEASQILLAHRRVDVRALNERARAVRRAAGELGADQVLPTARGERAFAEGDRLYFLKNERSLGVKNGTLGTVARISGVGAGASLVVRLDGAAGAGRGSAVSFALRDYAEIDHGYAATVHKSQGVTVDRAHVLATAGLDRHAAYVGLSRHRAGVSLHWSRDEMGSRAGLDARLGRERLKDTSLDYGAARDGEVLLRRYGERRGFDPLRPVSEIVVAEPKVARPPEQAVRRGKFAGLKLGGGRTASDPDQALEELALPTISQPRHGGRPEAQLGRAMGDYARAWSDAARMERMGLPVLPHQVLALERAGQALEATASGLSRDVRAALERTPALAHGHGQPAGMAMLNQAVGAERRDRLVLEERGRATLRAWDTLERAYEAAEKSYDWQGKRAAGTRLAAMAQALKRDPPLDGLLREHGRELGLAEGSRLERVVRSPDGALPRALRHELGLSQGHDLSLGR